MDYCQSGAVQTIIKTQLQKGPETLGNPERCVNHLALPFLRTALIAESMGSWSTKQSRKQLGGGIMPSRHLLQRLVLARCRYCPLPRAAFMADSMSSRNTG